MSSFCFIKAPLQNLLNSHHTSHYFSPLCFLPTVLEFQPKIRVKKVDFHWFLNEPLETVPPLVLKVRPQNVFLLKTYFSSLACNCGSAPTLSPSLFAPSSAQKHSKTLRESKSASLELGWVVYSDDWIRQLKQGRLNSSAFAFTHSKASSEQVDEVITDGQKHNYHPLSTHQIPITFTIKSSSIYLKEDVGEGLRWPLPSKEGLCPATPQKTKVQKHIICSGGLSTQNKGLTKDSQQ